MIVFAIFVIITLFSAVCLALTKKLVHAAFLLFMVLFGIAAIFVFAQAEFLAVSQIIVYVGGILILLVFGIMLTNRKLLQTPQTEIIQPLGAGIVSMLVMSGLGYGIYANDWEKIAVANTAQENANLPYTNIQFIGKELLTNYLLPFELMSVVLLVALIGAAYIARNSHENNNL